jgi:DNA repair ATPase RecN
MNAKQKKEIGKHKECLAAAVATLAKLAEPAETLKEIAGKISDVKTAIETIRDEVGEKFDNLSEAAQEGDKGTELSEAKDNLDTLVETLETVENDLQDDSITNLSLDEFAEKMTEISGNVEEASDKIDELV